MLRWARAWGLPRRGLRPCSPSFSTGPVAPSSSGRGGAEPRSVPLSYKLLDGEAARPALVFLHGLFGCKTNFNSIAKALAQQTGRRVLTVDARNHGDSPHSPDVSYEAMSQDLQDLLPQLDLVPCVLIGHSMGGKTAMLLALQRPELVERLIAVDISPVETTSSSDFPTYMAAMRAISIPDKVSRSCARKLADEQLSPVVQDMAVRQFLLTNLVEVDGRFVWRVNLDALAQHVDKIMAFPPRQESYPGPTLFLLGGNSQYVPCRPCLMLATGSTPTARRTSWLPFEASWPKSCWPKGTQNPRLQGPVVCSTFLHGRTQAGTEGVRVQRVRPQALMNKDTVPKVLG
ncbi:protein ABHD11 isoform X1 [Equus quagga]|uniref:protein ABHD11 isoform X1 n=1 Tax=Equus quagga TaxID=89248 RepID=UPI001EE39338|nr:protein ABHD11 isoform X1 [Equus quagga]XP_046523456.1 protein ABHD11 isoform X1 [Equus quagga]